MGPGEGWLPQPSISLLISTTHSPFGSPQPSTSPLISTSHYLPSYLHNPLSPFLSPQPNNSLLISTTQYLPSYLHNPVSPFLSPQPSVFFNMLISLWTVVILIPQNYLVKTTWAGRPNGQQDILPKATSGVSLWYLWTNVTRGETYHFQVRTIKPNSQFSKELLIHIRKWESSSSFVWWYIILSWDVLWKDWIVVFKVNITAKVQICFGEFLSGWSSELWNYL